MRRSIRNILVCLVGFSIAHSAFCEDWPHWRGPKRDGISTEKRLLADWPEKGPQELWRTPLGNGFSGVSVVGDRAYTMFGTDAGEFAICIDAANGKPVWKARVSDLLKNDSYGDGPRATPVVDAGKVYVLSGKGALQCFDAADGKPVWGCDLHEKFGCEAPEYGFAASPIILSNVAIAVTGAQKGKSLVAFDKTSGNILWTSLDDKIGYSTPMPATIDGVDQLIVLMGEALVSVSPKDGKEYWREEWKTELNANATTPIINGNRLFVSTGYSTGCALFELSAKGGKPTATKLWANKEMKNYFSTSVLLDGFLYGFNNTKLTCLDFSTGKTKWKTGGFNRGSLIAADGKLIVLGEAGALALVEISSKSYKELAKFQFCDERTWTVPTLSGGRLFVRNEKELACLKLK